MSIFGQFLPYFQLFLYINKTYDENNNNEWTKAIEKEWMGVAREDFENRVHPTLTFSQRIGNMYTPSIYSSLVSLIANLEDNSSNKSSYRRYRDNSEKNRSLTRTNRLCILVIFFEKNIFRLFLLLRSLVPS